MTGVDSAFERTAHRLSGRLVRVHGDATEIPLPSGRADVVLSLDMFEHLPADKRAAALSEMLRLLAPSGRMILGFPAGATAAALDRRLNTSFEAEHGRPHPWVSEHIENGLPDVVEVGAQLAALADPGATVRSFGHMWGPAWYAMHLLYTVRAREPLARRLGLWSPTGARPVFELLRWCNSGSCYRTIFVVDKPPATLATVSTSPAPWWQPAKRISR